MSGLGKSWATFPDPRSFPMGTDKNQLRKDAVLCSWTSSVSRCLYNWWMAWPCWEVHGMLPWSISCALAPLKMFVLKISKGKNKWVFRTKLKITISRAKGLRSAGKWGSLAISPPNTTHVHAFCIWECKHARTRNHCLSDCVLRTKGGWKSPQRTETWERQPFDRDTQANSLSNL